MLKKPYSVKLLFRLGEAHFSDCYRYTCLIVVVIIELNVHVLRSKLIREFLRVFVQSSVVGTCAWLKLITVRLRILYSFHICMA